MRLSPWLPFLADLGALPPCARGDFAHCQHDAEKCAKHAQRTREVDWPTCPVREVIGSAEVRYIRTLDRDAEAAPLAGWTYRYAAWVPRFLGAYRAEREEAEASQQRVKVM